MKVKKLTSVLLSICLSLVIGIQVKAVDTTSPKVNPQDEFNSNTEKYLNYARKTGFSKYLNMDALVADYTKDSLKANPSNIKTFKNFTKSIDVEKVRPTIKNDDDLIALLKTNFGKLETPVGNWDFSFQIFQNHVQSQRPEINMSPYDYRVEINFTNNINPYHLLSSSKKYTEKQRTETVELLTNYEKQMADFLIEITPNKKITGSFYTNTITKEKSYSASSAIFLTWVNYSNANDKCYITTKQTSFYWNDTDDSCIFSK